MTVNVKQIITKKRAMIILKLHGLTDLMHLKSFIIDLGNKNEYVKREVYVWLGYDYGHCDYI